MIPVGKQPGPVPGSPAGKFVRGLKDTGFSNASSEADTATGPRQKFRKEIVLELSQADPRGRLAFQICDDESGLVPANQAKSFAEGLAIGLGDLGYSHIRVVGYLGEVSADEGSGVLKATGPRGGGYYPLNEKTWCPSDQVAGKCRSRH